MDGWMFKIPGRCVQHDLFYFIIYFFLKNTMDQVMVLANVYQVEEKTHSEHGFLVLDACLCLDASTVSHFIHTL